MDSEERVLIEAVQLILDARVEEALELLSSYYGIPTPKIKVGLPKRCRNALGCYDPRKSAIYVKSSSEYMNPFIILHEYYHHLRSILGRHRGTEKHADQYALNAIHAWRRINP